MKVSPKAYLKDLDEQIDRDRKALGKRPFERDDHDDDAPTGKSGGEIKEKMERMTDPESRRQNRQGKPTGFYFREHRTVDSKRNIIVNVHVEPVNLNDVTPAAENL